MTTQERVNALMAHGFTQRQAVFVAMVLLHSGVCVPRQYCAFVGTGWGQVARDFFDKLSDRKLATMYPGGASGGSIFHLHRKSLYRAIGEPNSRLGRRGTVTRAVERLMVLDAVLANRDIPWLATENEKIDYFTQQRGLALAELPSLTYVGAGQSTTRYFPDRLPIGVGATRGETVFLHVVTSADGQAFRAFLERHESTFRRLPRWRIILALPRAIAQGETTHRKLFSDMCAGPLRPALVDEFRWFCRMRRAQEEHVEPVASIDPVRFARAHRAFGDRRFYGIYRRWCRDGEGALQRLMTPAFQDAWRRGDAALDTLVLPHVYGENGPLARAV